MSGSSRLTSIFTPGFIIGLLGLAVMGMTINGCGSTPKNNNEPLVDRELQASNRMARLAFQKGDYRQATNTYQKALETAYVRNDSAAILDARYNLAVCLMELEQYPQAIKLVDQALDEFATGGEKIPPDLLLLQATIFYRHDRLEDSWQATQKILGLHTSLSPALQARTHFLRGLISSRNNDVAGISQSIRNMGQPESKTVKSDQAELQGRLAMAEKKWDQAVIDLDQATRLRRDTRDYRRMAITLALSAEASQEAGLTEAAASRYLQAGRSAALRDDQLNARQWLTQAALLFEQVGNQALTAESNSLLLGLEEGSDPMPSGQE